MWNIIDNGRTIGTNGSENGIIEKDEEFNGLARITLEKCEEYYAITCGVDGMVHTVFCNKYKKDTIYENMKKDLQEFSLKETTEDEKIKFYEEFTSKYWNKWFYKFIKRQPTILL